MYAHGFEGCLTRSPFNKGENPRKFQEGSNSGVYSLAILLLPAMELSSMALSNRVI